MHSIPPNKDNQLYRDLEEFHSLVARFFNGELFSNIEKYFWYYFAPLSICKEQARAVSRKYAALRDQALLVENSSGLQIHKEAGIYEGKNAAVIQLKKYLAHTVKDYLYGAYVHGSLATGEEIAYSDFDALLIIKNDVFENTDKLAYVCSKVLDSKKILYEYDPLQHHGFFILTELDLNHYCQEYFPTVLFDHAKSLFHDKGLNLLFKIRPSSKEGVIIFKNLANAIKGKLERKNYPKNYYELKLLLSQFMLMPALYLQAKGQYVFKKESFELARKEFTTNDWEIMDEVTKIRSEWDFCPSHLFSLYKKDFRGHFWSTLYQKKIGQNISARINTYLTEEFYSNMLDFVELMNKKIETDQIIPKEQ